MKAFESIKRLRFSPIEAEWIKALDRACIAAVEKSHGSKGPGKQ